MEKKLMPFSHIVFNSQQALNQFKEVSKKKFHHKFYCIPNGYNIPLNVEMNENPALISIGSLGRFTYQKNFIQLVRSYHQFYSGLSMPSQLILQGSQGDESPSILDYIEKNNCQEHIKILSENKNIALFFQKIHIFVLSSHFEGCPNVLFEALLHKKLCIISQGANSDNYITNGDNGIVYDGTDQGLVSALHYAAKIKDTEAEKQMIANGFNYAVSNYSMESMVKKYENLFITIYEKNKSSN